MAKKKSKLWYIIIGIVVIGVVALLVAKKQGVIGNKEVTEVEVGLVKSADIVEKVSASGKIQPEVEVKISPDVSGEIIEMNVEEGDSVVKGELLCRIRPDNYQSLLDRAQASQNAQNASLAQAKAVMIGSETRLIRATQDYERNKKLYGGKVISDNDMEISKNAYDLAKQDVESSKASLDASKFNVESSKATVKDAAESLRKTTIYAPMSGIVSKKTVEKGERVVGTAQMTGTEIMRIANLRNMEVLVDVNENDIVRINLNDTAEIDIDSYSSQGRKFMGVVTSIANTAKAALSADVVTEFEVKVRILNQSYADLVNVKGKKFPFRPGMTGSVDIITEKRQGVISVPLACVTTRKDDGNVVKDEGKDDNNDDAPKVTNSKDVKVTKDASINEVVFVLGKDNKVEQRKVKTGISDFENIQVLSGLKVGEKVVLGPYLVVSKTLKNGDVVKAQTEDAKSKAKNVGAKTEKP